MQAFAGTVYTFAHANKIGAKVGPQCTMCGDPSDSAYHRLFLCGPVPRMKLPPPGKSLIDMMCWRPSEALPLRTPRVTTFEYYEVNYSNGHLSIRSVEAFSLPDDMAMYTDGSC